MHVAQIWRYPVKSLGGEQLERADIGALGLDGDRRWGIRDRATGNILTARRQPEMLFARATLVEDRPLIVARDGRQLDGDDDLSEWLGLDVELVAAGGSATFEAPLDAGPDSEWMSWQGPPGAWHDSGKSRVSIVSTFTLDSQDPRRFRPNLVLESTDRERTEDKAVGSVVSIGSCLLDIGKQISRCVMVTRPQPGLDRDLDLLKRISRERDGKLAVGATVVRPGSVSVGDAVMPLHSGAES